jgi:hypothetical protein
VEQHNCHAALLECKVAPLEEGMKIHYFEDVISNNSCDSGKSTILADHQKFKDFDAVLGIYVNFKRFQKPDDSFRVPNVSALQGRGGGG